MNTFEEIYGTKTAVNINNIFKKCENEVKQVLVLGRAGIGKSTFCQYVAYQWASGVLLSEYDLVVLVPLRSLTADSASTAVDYTPIDLVEKQYFFNHVLSRKEEEILKIPFDKSKVLWLLDGYDEIIGHTPVEAFTKKLLEYAHHILTSRPYAITLSYDVKMEITEWSETISLTMTALYDQMTEWLCRRYAENHGLKTKNLVKDEVYEHCKKELAFLETLAFHGMETKNIILNPLSLRKAEKESNWNSKDIKR